MRHPQRLLITFAALITVSSCKSEAPKPPPLLLTVKSEEVLSQQTTDDAPVSLTFAISASAGLNRTFFGCLFRHVETLEDKL